jgi:hypothetical protein
MDKDCVLEAGQCVCVHASPGTHEVHYGDATTVVIPSASKIREVKPKGYSVP